jgi:hypothetical protein
LIRDNQHLPEAPAPPSPLLLGHPPPTLETNPKSLNVVGGGGGQVLAEFTLSGNLCPLISEGQWQEVSGCCFGRGLTEGGLTLLHKAWNSASASVFHSPSWSVCSLSPLLSPRLSSGPPAKDSCMSPPRDSQAGMRPFFCLPIHPSTHPSSTHLSLQPLPPSFPSIHPCIHLTLINPCIYLSIHSFTFYPSIHLSFHPSSPINPFIHPFIHSLRNIQARPSAGLSKTYQSICQNWSK